MLGILGKFWMMVQGKQKSSETPIFPFVVVSAKHRNLYHPGQKELTARKMAEQVSIAGFDCDEFQI